MISVLAARVYTRSVRNLQPGSRCTRRTSSVQNNPGLPVEPAKDSCCGRGCANCVWLEYANEMIKYYSGKQLDEIVKEIETKVPDANVRAFVLAELRMKLKKE